MTGLPAAGYVSKGDIAGMIMEPLAIDRSQLIQGPFVSGESIELSLNPGYVAVISAHKCPLAAIESAAQQRFVEARWSYDDSTAEQMLFLHCDATEVLRILLDAVAQTVGFLCGVQK